MGSIVQFARDGLTSLISGLGTSRDKSATTFYAPPTLDHHQLVNAYRSSWLPRKIVDIPALDSCRNWRLWKASADQIEKIEAEEKRLGLKGKVLEAHKKARLFGGAAIYFDLGDDPTQPLDLSRVGQGAIRFLTVLTPRHLSPGEIETDPLSEWYGRPRDYTIHSASAGMLKIHPSRLAIFIGAEVPEPEMVTGQQAGWGDSALTAVFEAVKQADATSANIASLVFEAKVDVITMEGLMDYIGDPAGEQKVLTRYRLAAQAKGNNGMLILDGKESYEQKSGQFSTLPDIMDRFFQNVSGAADIPMTRLFGQSPGGLNASGESDLRNYYDRISSAQELEMQPAMWRLDECLIRSVLGSRDEAIHFEWAPLWQLSEKERADIFKTKADAARVIAGQGGMSPELMPIEALSDALVNALIEDGALPGLEGAIEEYGKLSEQEDDEDDAAVAMTQPISGPSEAARED